MLYCGTDGQISFGGKVLNCHENAWLWHVLDWFINSPHQKLDDCIDFVLAGGFHTLLTVLPVLALFQTLQQRLLEHCWSSFEMCFICPQRNLGVMFLGAADVWPVLCEVLWSLSLREGLSTIQQQCGSNWNSLIWQTVIWLWRVALHLMLGVRLWIMEIY